MAPISHPEENKKYEILESQIRECFGRVAWSHKTQEKCADILITRNSRIKLAQIILSAITITSLIFFIIGQRQIGVIIGVIFSTILLILNTYLKDHDLGEIAQKHANSANDLWDIREMYLSLLTDIKAGVVSIEDIIQKRDGIQEELSNIYNGAPRTIPKAYSLATKALKMNEELTFSDEEIDLLLPIDLRKMK